MDADNILSQIVSSNLRMQDLLISALEVVPTNCDLHEKIHEAVQSNIALVDSLSKDPE
ncbi:hypothetical protein ACKF11_03845 [Methylobacillus sp. Pita2]|uniref:hypothetical protein n=1 Tax=Methylobacillus sp. Pita2 TaxID=3383245 RepID=UPI0038B5E95C